jgi:hypothetical protein
MGVQNNGRAERTNQGILSVRLKALKPHRENAVKVNDQAMTRSRAVFGPCLHVFMSTLSAAAACDSDVCLDVCLGVSHFYSYSKAFP